MDSLAYGHPLFQGAWMVRCGSRTECGAAGLCVKTATQQTIPVFSARTFGVCISTDFLGFGHATTAL